MRICALLLAAGEGRRMARGPKALLPLDGETFLARCLRSLSVPGVAEIVVVLGKDAELVARSCPLPPQARLVGNPAWAEGMLSSVLAGLEAAASSAAEGVLVHPVDCPVVDPATVRRVVEALEQGAPIAVPSHERRRGHPAGFARSTWEALRAAPRERGLRSVLQDHPEWVRHVEGDPGCLVDVDTQADWERLSRP